MKPAWPTLSIVTPSFNQGQFLEAAIQSVVSQDYPALEYVIVDGGSSDSSPDIIRRYENRLHWWTSAADHGQYDAINKGFQHTTGDVMGYLNSDDMYLPGALSVVGQVFAEFPAIDWITTLYPVGWNRCGQAVECRRFTGFSAAKFRRGGNLPGQGWPAEPFIQQESTFWRRSLWEKTGGYISTDFGRAGDFELWLRFFQHTELYGVQALIGGFRGHPDQQTSLHGDEYAGDAVSVLGHYDCRPYGPFSSLFRRRLLPLLAPVLRPRRWCARLGVYYPVSIIAQEWTDDRWQMHTRYIA